MVRATRVALIAGAGSMASYAIGRGSAIDFCLSADWGFIFRRPQKRPMNHQEVGAGGEG